MKKILFMGMVVMVFTGMTQAALIAYEGFEGVAGEEVSGSGSGWAVDSAWGTTSTVGTFVYEDPGLTHKTLQVSGLSATFKGDGLTQEVVRYGRNLETPVTLTTAGDEVWASYILDMKETLAGRGFGVELTDSGTSVVAFGKGVNKSSGLGTAFTTADLLNVGNPSGVKLLMLKLAYDGTDTQATLYIDGSATAPLGSASALGSITLAGAITIDGVNLVGYHKSTLDNTLDELRIGDTKADIIPILEPATLALLGIGVMLTRRKK